ncbi:MAG: hypothetical protein Q9M36_09180 [Sulfurovum sp.]|nr:hypothetical protein [Sulfurovum sp.]
MQSYISRLHEGTCLNEAFTEKNFEDMRDAEMSNLNRLQSSKMRLRAKKTSISPNAKVKVGVNDAKIIFTSDAPLLLFLGGCTPMPVDNTPYEVKACQKSLRHGTELQGLKVDKLVVYKKKRELSMWYEGKVLETFRISLGKNGTKGIKYKKGIIVRLKGIIVLYAKSVIGDSINR